MKKTLAIILLAAALALSACGDGETTSLDSESGSSEYRNMSEASGEYLAEYQNQIEELKKQLDGARHTIDELREANESLQKALDDQGEDKIYRLSRTHIGGGIYLLLYAQNETDVFANRITVSYPDGNEVTVADIGSLLFSDHSVSPGKAMIAAIEMEVTRGVYLFDIEKRETAEILMEEIDISEKVMHVEWLDDRYLLCTVWKTGFVSGGDVYTYDTQTGAFRMLATKSDDDYQINHVVRYADDFVLFVCEKFGSSFEGNPEYIYFHLTLDEIYEHISNNTVVDFDL